PRLRGPRHPEKRQRIVNIESRNQQKQQRRTNHHRSKRDSRHHHRSPVAKCPNLPRKPPPRKSPPNLARTNLLPPVVHQRDVEQKRHRHRREQQNLQHKRQRQGQHPDDDHQKQAKHDQLQILPFSPKRKTPVENQQNVQPD